MVRTRLVAALDVVLILPAALFMLCVFLRSAGQPHGPPLRTKKISAISAPSA